MSSGFGGSTERQDLPVEPTPSPELDEFDRRAIEAAATEKERLAAFLRLAEEAVNSLGIPSWMYHESVRDLRLPTRLTGLLRRSGFTSVGQVLELMAKGDDEVFVIRGLGRTYLGYLKNAMAERGLDRYLRRPEATTQARVLPGADLCPVCGHASFVFSSGWMECHTCGHREDAPSSSQPEMGNPAPAETKPELTLEQKYQAVKDMLVDQIMSHGDTRRELVMAQLALAEAHQLRQEARTKPDTFNQELWGEHTPLEVAAKVAILTTVLTQLIVFLAIKLAK